MLIQTGGFNNIGGKDVAIVNLGMIQKLVDAKKRDAEAVIGDEKPCATSGFAAPGKQYLSTLRRIAHGVSRQVGKGRTQFPGTAQQSLSLIHI